MYLHIHRNDTFQTLLTSQIRRMRERKGDDGLHLTPHLNRQLAAYGVEAKPHMISKELVDPDAGNLKDRESTGVTE